MRHHMTLPHDPDHQALTTNLTTTITTTEGKRVTVLPFCLGPTHSQPHRKVQSTIQRPTPVQTPIPSMPPGTQIPMQPQPKKMQPPTTMSSVRVPSTGSMRPPAPPTTPTISTHVAHSITENPTDTPNSAPSEGNTVSQDAVPQSQPETQAQSQPESIAPTPTSTPPVGPPLQNQQPTPIGMNPPVITNSYSIPVAGFSATVPDNTSQPYPGQTSNVLSTHTTEWLHRRVPAGYVEWDLNERHHPRTCRWATFLVAAFTEHISHPKRFNA